MSDTEGSSHYDMNALEEYTSLFGNPFIQTTKEVIYNAKSLSWPNTEIIRLFDEMLDEICKKSYE